MAVNRPDRTAVLAGIRSLSAARAPRLEQVELTLTDGYAYALELETERLRLQRSLAERAVLLDDEAGADGVAELRGLAQGVAEADGRLAELRAALALLKETADRLR